MLAGLKVNMEANMEVMFNNSGVSLPDRKERECGHSLFLVPVK